MPFGPQNSPRSRFGVTTGVSNPITVIPPWTGFNRGFEYPLPPNLLNAGPVVITFDGKIRKQGTGEVVSSPLSFIEEDRQTRTSRKYDMPIEPILNIRGGHKIIHSLPVGSRAGGPSGTIKEYWTQRDTQISVKGIIIRKTVEGLKTDIENLKNLFYKSRSVGVLGPLLNAMDILRVVVRDFELPHTKGFNCQMYKMTLLSDSIIDPIITAESLEQKEDPYPLGKTIQESPV